MAGPTGLEPATSGVTGLRSNQLSYDPKDPGRRSIEKPPKKASEVGSGGFAATAERIL